MSRSILRNTPRIVRPWLQCRACLVASANSNPGISSERQPNRCFLQIHQQHPSDIPNPTIDLHDHRKLYASFSTGKLMKSLVILQVAAQGSMADLGAWVMRSAAMEDPTLRRVVLGVTERTFFEHFCGGKDLEEAGATVLKLWQSGLSGMLDYGLEHSDGNESCDINMSEFIRSIEWTKSLDSPCVSFVVVKITAICTPTLLRRVSDLLRWEHNHEPMQLQWKLKTLPIFTKESPFYHTVTMPAPLTLEEEKDLELACQRLDKICQRSAEANIPLLIDAEDTSIQPAIDYFTYSAAIKHSSADGEPLIFNTIQAYLKDSQERLVAAKRAADKMRVPVGFKLVRGAYMSSEEALAKSLGVDSPIHNGITETHACYNGCVEFMLHEIAKRKGAVVLATHNIESSKLAAAKASDLGIKKRSRHLQFAQLYGMSEALSYGLKDAGFKVSKYLAFGPVEQIMPYLIRRAEENKGLLSTSSLDRLLMRKELWRRLKSRWFPKDSDRHRNRPGDINWT